MSWVKKHIGCLGTKPQQLVHSVVERVTSVVCPRVAGHPNTCNLFGPKSTTVEEPLLTPGSGAALVDGFVGFD